MTRQDRATTERFTKTLRELVKRPENKVCADCKRNDPRWASWNIGVFLCIRCSGIHRGMGTHISKVKSVDLDTWTPEQMESIQKWGNHLANLYWEAHLKPGHVPPEHKMESFIRSKYESRRWALDGPPPTDPSVLASGSPSAYQQQAPAPIPPVTAPTHTSSNSISSRTSTTTRQPQAHQLLSSSFASPTHRQPRAPVPPPVTVKAPSPPPLKAPENDLFSLDFHAAPATSVNETTTSVPKKDVKQDILSLFSAPPPVSAPSAFGQFGVGVSSPAQAQIPVQASPWGTAQPQSQPHQQTTQQFFQHQSQQYHQPPPQPTSLVGNTGVGAWGASSGWSGPATSLPPGVQNTNSIWGGSTPTTANAGLFNTNAVWGSTAPATATAPAQDLFSAPFASSGGVQKKENDVFGDLWGGFK
ncbi:hypothetical protein Hypma_008195 [Hypsizygus marmoreus]|uniref:Arf-GAP domain-containing protein n=1 Tax=Hypsizygus marmoreus TaxID=39966 RepID=A0A369K0S8_HYPMA|nr:hypothetical protein Hypma_008195 [Hypsizygus marmoreus]